MMHIVYYKHVTYAAMTVSCAIYSYCHSFIVVLVLVLVIVVVISVVMFYCCYRVQARWYTILRFHIVNEMENRRNMSSEQIHRHRLVRFTRSRTVIESCFIHFVFISKNFFPCVSTELESLFNDNIELFMVLQQKMCGEIENVVALTSIR